MNNLSNWPTEQVDMQLANTIIEKYLDMSEGEPLGLIEVVLNDQAEQIDVRPADWVVELAERFSEKYGQDQGEFITSQVITRCLLKGETIH